MSKKEESLETTMTREVKTLYFGTMHSNFEFYLAPYLDMQWFKQHFATVAHQHGIFHGNGQESRNQYNMYFRLVRSRLSEAVRRLEKNGTKNQPAVTPPKTSPPPMAPPAICDSAAARERLKQLREELAARPARKW